ncbi:MAG TPA: bifunctional hydroxymethylpyrimidine kinase/phosphomethylpyrimidine kinase [Sphingobacterium sp.]|jgi:hydroxymethylpyrimidine/phosphomethylpyrimidine kinase|nr:bifunctional hydroxymethylpyrimidine kinase/phosphomethylpyrimidine kinase [Sphingobacterium sp.]
MKEKRDNSVPTVLSIAGFDGSGGAGIQADTKTISSLGCYAMNVLTALPVQNTQGVRTIYDIPTEAVSDQLEVIFDDIYPDAIKIGMVHSVALVKTISHFLRDYRGQIVFDPVMISTSGHKLIQDETIQACVSELFPLSTVITPNLDEISELIQRRVDDVEKMEKAGEELLQSTGVQAVLVKGGHLDAEILTTLLLQRGEPPIPFQSPRIQTRNTHGSGCTLSSAIASYLALDYELEAAVGSALEYVHYAIRGSKDLRIGKGSGPLNHFFNPQKLVIHEMDR